MAVKNSLVQPKEVLGYIPWSMDRLITEEEEKLCKKWERKNEHNPNGHRNIPEKAFSSNILTNPVP